MDTYSGNNPYPYGSGFPISQYSNPYSLYNGMPMPWPSQYGGTPTNAFGQPIASYQQAQQAFQQQQQAAPPPAATPGTSLNTSAANPSAGYSAANPPPGGSMYGVDPNNPGVTYASEQARTPAAMYSRFMGALPGPQFNGFGGSDSQAANTTNALMGQLAANQYYGSTQPQRAAPAAPAAPAFNSRAAALQALANPGHVATPGANVPYNQGAVSTGPGVLQQFLQNWQQRGAPTKGAGNYNNAGFFNTLQGMAARPAAGG